MENINPLTKKMKKEIKEKSISKRIEQLSKKARVSEEYLALSLVIGTLFRNKKPQETIKELEKLVDN